MSGDEHWCPRCGEKTVWTVEHDLTFERYPDGREYPSMRHMMACGKCGTRVNVDAWNAFQRLCHRLGDR